MSSSEIARLAGVSVRTLRHYHRVGVLPEPRRRANGYREYTVHDLILLLRIRRLTDLGLSLDEIPPLLASTDHADSVLEQLDGELAVQIERLTARREVIARLRAAGASPDTPPELAGLVAVTSGQPGVTPAAARQDRDLLTLMHHVLDEDGRRALTDFFTALVHPDLLPATTSLANRFSALDAETPATDVDQLFADYQRTFGHLEDSRLPSFEGSRLGALFAAYQDPAFNEAQRAFVARFTHRPVDTA
ncbi:MerR family transcriptional regulator [Micromonospora sp. NPDC050187]|uniref:MerR family transcriptional regulator n=1 Tax=Micromonospora sp. NPDC050187 TaxID=3364277 RepID=UPI0037A57312